VGSVQPEPQPTELLNRPAGRPEGRIQIIQDSTWQMSFGERAALEGVLSQLRPKLAVEIGTAEGGSLARVAAHSDEVHSFDLVPPAEQARSLANVTFHTGDSHALLPELLARFADEGRNVDFALVDGDHSADGVHQDMCDLLDSPALAQSVILAHDTANPAVREGLDRVRYAAYPKVAYVELDLVAGYMFREPSLLHELWGGLGLVRWTPRAAPTTPTIPARRGTTRRSACCLERASRSSTRRAVAARSSGSSSSKRSFGRRASRSTRCSARLAGGSPLRCAH
jgi:hypothetical protein